MKVTISNAKVGDTVVLTTNVYGKSENNPVWDGVSKPVVGTIFDVESACIWVKWANGQNNNYDSNTLELYTAPAVTPSVTVTPTSAATFPVVANPPTIPRSSLKQAVEDAINRVFVSKGLSFSGYDVTSALRREVNENRVIIDGLPYATINGLTTQRITHDDIRTLVRDCMNMVSSYDRCFNGDYFVYQPNATAQTPVATPAPRQTMTFTPTKTVTTNPATPSSFVSSLRSYVTNRPNAPTLKQIQSRFKVENAPQYTIRYIAKVASDHGLKVEVGTPYYRSVVRA